MPGDYPLENLDDARFQQLCQALLIREHPNVQCFPVHQPDGGRDVVVFRGPGRDKPFVVFQVKFRRRGATDADARAWLENALRDEVPKLMQLVPRGAVEYVVMTNVAGTSHLGAGSIDRADALLGAAEPPIPVRCLWRDDICRRLDGTWDLKWAYPELLAGADLLRGLIEAGLTEHKTRRTNAIQQFVAGQYLQERQVRFKQVELHSPLLDLFTDVPLAGSTQPDLLHVESDSGRLATGLPAVMRIVGLDLARAARVAAESRAGAPAAPPPAPGSDAGATWAYPYGTYPHGVGNPAHVVWLDRAMSVERGDAAQLSLLPDEFDEEYDEDYPWDWHDAYEARGLGAAAFLAHPLTQHHFPQIVLEGAPGQGKSTITQFLCQVDRMRLLGKQFDLARLDAAYLRRGVRLPIRADLRDFATWLAGRDPFTPGARHEAPAQWASSLESFLAALIRYHSGGATFDASDLLEVARVSAVLVVLDGLDEVADPARRGTVVEAIAAGVGRLQEIAPSLQVIVTSRPVAFADAPSLPDADFPRVRLGPLTRPAIEEYANKWLETRRVEAREADEFRRVLTTKLDLPHMRDLARNPMQLAILLSLLNARGASLPDKRTALYGSYMDVFFGREAEKTPTVRTHRDLLLALHGYLAWLLHAEAESGTGDQRGRITQERLERVVTEYLRTEGHDPALATQLFTGVVERVVALVSLTQGTYEFEVQPLREYFAARHLYETAQYSRAGEERRGTKPDRFDAIARSPYWQNVARFFAGFSDKGELPMLVERLHDLADDARFRHTSHPAALSATLLADWVFAQSPRTVHQVAGLAFEPARLRTLLAAVAERGVAGDPLALPAECGRAVLLDRVFEALRGTPPFDYGLALTSVAVGTGADRELFDRWRGGVAAAAARPADASRWLTYASHLGILPRVVAADVDALLAGNAPTSVQAAALLRAGRLDVLGASPARGAAAVDALLDGYYRSDGRPPATLVDAAAVALTHSPEPAGSHGVRVLAAAAHVTSGLAPSAAQERAAEFAARLPDAGLPDAVREPLRAFVRDAVALAAAPRSDWDAGLDAWEALVDGSRRALGGGWIHLDMASAASRVRLAPEEARRVGGQSPELADDHAPLVRRVWYARRQANRPEWWARQLATASTDFSRAVACSLLVAWGSARVVEATQSALDDALQALPDRWWGHVAHRAEQNFADRRHARRDGAPGKHQDSSFAVRSDLGLRAAILLGMRQGEEGRRRLYRERLASERGGGWYVQRFAMGEALQELLRIPEAWQAPLRSVAAAYAAGVYGAHAFGAIERRFGGHDMPPPMVDEVTTNPTRYPLALLAAAEHRLRGVGRVPSVAEIAASEEWFA